MPPVAPGDFVRAGARHELRASTTPGDGAFELAIVRLENGEALGTVSLAFPGGGVLEILHLWVAVPFRGYGAGSEAAQMIIAAAAEHGFTVVNAWAHPALGLSVYFWIRMGLHPQHGPGPHAGLLFTRELGVRTAR